MTISYTFGDLEDLSGAIGKAESNVEGIKSDIHSSSGKLAQAWNSDQAQVSWGAEQKKWDDACENLKQALHQLAMKVLDASEGMAHTEAKNAQLFAGE
jgi:WXG100 family type VII secretion target